MAKVIVGIHGLANKPPKGKLEEYWKKSITEGLKKNCQITNAKFDFRLVFWADLLYKKLMHDDDLFDFDGLYNTEPYTEGPAKLPTYDDGILDWARSKGSSLVGGTLDFVKNTTGMDGLASWVLEKTLKDLDFYYDPKRKIGDRSKPKPKPVLARKVLQAELWNALKPLLKNQDEVMLIAHSMGSIIAYDVLRDLGQKHREFVVDHFVTIGSPLGLPFVKGKIVEERAYAGLERGDVRTPTIVGKGWKNYADRRDPVALDTHLRDDFGPNDRGIRVQDDLISNSYLSLAGKPNYHKSYGYLRAPELSAQIRDFLAG